MIRVTSPGFARPVASANTIVSIWHAFASVNTLGAVSTTVASFTVHVSIQKDAPQMIMIPIKTRRSSILACCRNQP